MITESKQKQLRLLAQLEKTEYWRGALKPYLENIKTEIQTSKRDYKTSFETAKADIKRATTLDTIDTIIDEVELANDKASNNYQEG